MPPEVEAELRAILVRLTTEASGALARTVRLVSSDHDRAETLRIADAERRRDDAEAGTSDVLEPCRKAEAGLRDAAQHSLSFRKVGGETSGDSNADVD